MFNIKNIVNKITDRGRDSNPNSPGRAAHEDDNLSSQRAEGFLCPKCMKAFGSPSELQLHYESLHAEESATDGYGASAAGFYSLHQEVGERYKHPMDGTPSNTVQGSSINTEEGKSELDRFSSSFDGGLHGRNLILSSITDVPTLQKMLVEVLDGRAALQTENEHLKQRAVQLAQLNVTLKAACDEGESNQIALKERLKVVEAQLAHRESIDDAAVLRQELVQVQRVMDELNREREQERDALKAELQLMQSSRNEEMLSKLEDDVVRKEAEIIELRSALEDSKRKCSDLTTQFEAETSSKSSLVNDAVETLQQQLTAVIETSENDKEALRKEINKVNKEKNDLEMKLNVLEQKSDESKGLSEQTIEQLQRRLSALKLKSEETDEKLKLSMEEMGVLSKERNDLKTELERRIHVIEEMEQNKASSENRTEALHSDLSNCRAKISQLESEHSELVAQIQVGEGAKTAIQQLTQENSLLQSKLEEERDRSSKFKEESFKSVQQVTKQLSETEKQKREIEEALKKEQSLSLQLKMKVDTLIDQQKTLQEMVATKETSLEEIKSLNRNLKSNLEDIERKYKEGESIISEQKQEMAILNKSIRNLEERSNELETDLSKAQKEISEIKQAFESSKQDNEILNHKLIEGNKSNKELEDINKSLQDTIFQKEDDCSHLKEENVKLAEEIVCLGDKLKSTEGQLQVIGVQRASLETSLFELQKSMAELEGEKKDLEEEKTKEIVALKEVLKTKTENLEKREEAVKILMSERVTLTEQLDSQQKAHQVEVSAAKRKCNKLQEELDTCLSSKNLILENLSEEEKKSANLQKEVEELTLSLENTIKESAVKEKSLQASLDEVTGEKLALDVQLEASHTELQALLVRCYASASETETLQRTIADLRRKLDESQAALHELGRENQTLQLDIDKLIGRKWAEDSEVNQCTLCNRDFSLILRKHHCRNCGQIFCNECSSKTAPIASNKKPVRVCDSCFGELTPK